MVFIKCLAWFSTNGQLAIRQIKKLRPRALVVKSLPASSRDIRDVGSIPGSRRSPEGGHGNPTSLAWRIPWTEELGGLQSIRLHRVRHNWNDSMHASSEGYCLTFISPNLAQNTFPCTILFSIYLSFLFQKLSWYTSIYISRVHECISIYHSSYISYAEI